MKQRLIETDQFIVLPTGIDFRKPGQPDPFRSKVGQTSSQAFNRLAALAVGQPPAPSEAQIALAQRQAAGSNQFLGGMGTAGVFGHGRWWM